jgi:molybdopterin/thiamine biosynthesis adenylyltransferase
MEKFLNDNNFNSYYIKDACLYHKLDNITKHNNINDNNFISQIKIKLFRISRLIVNKIF